MSPKSPALEKQEPMKIDLFKGRHEIRKVLHDDEWWFSVVDVVRTLAGSEDPGNYWRVLKNRLKEEGSSQTITNCNGLKLLAEDGKMRLTDCANTETMLRIVQSIPSPNAEPFKRWLAKVGFERIQEIEKPALAVKRARAIYLAKGYDDEWIERRVQSIQKREELTDEWKNRGIEAGQDYAILTAEISKATFGLTPSQYKDTKGLEKRDSLRDNMTPLELIFSTLGEVAAKEITTTRDTQGFDENKQAAHDGGKIAGDARRALEQETRKKVVSSKNYKLDSPKKVMLNPTNKEDK